MERLVRFVTRRPLLVIASWLVLIAALGSQIPRLRIDTDLKAMLPEDYPARELLARFDDIFGGSEIAIVAVQAPDVFTPAALAQVDRITRRLADSPLVNLSTSITGAMQVRGAAGELIVERLIPDLPRTDAEAAEARARVLADEMVRGKLVSEDGALAAVVAHLAHDCDDGAVRGMLETIAREEDGRPGRVLYTGIPLFRAVMTEYMLDDLARFLPIGIVLMVLLLAASFRSARGVLLPLAVVVLSIVAAAGLLAVLEQPFTMLQLLLPVMLIAVANDYGIHLVARYYEDVREMAPIGDRAAVVRRGLRHVWAPVALAGVTTFFGFGTLLAHIMPPARVLGIASAFGIVVALLLSVTFIPAFLALMRFPRFLLDPRREFAYDRLARLTARAVGRRPRTVVALFLAASVSSALFLPRLVVDVHPLRHFQEDDPLVVTSYRIGEAFGGVVNVNVLVEGEIQDPAVLREMARVQAFLASLPEVSSVVSPVDWIRRIHRAMRDGEPADDEIPDTRELVAQVLLLASMSGGDELLDGLVDPGYRRANISGRLAVESTKGAKAVVDRLSAYLAQEPPLAARFQVTGYAMLMSELLLLVIRGQLLSLGLSLVLVSLITALVFRSAAAALICVAPIAAALLMVFGFMGLRGIEINAITALLSSIMVGVGVDYAVHFLWRYRAEARKTGVGGAAFEKTLLTTGRGIVFNALSVAAGFAVLLVSHFAPLNFFGWLVVLSILTSLAGSLTLVPALLALFRPRFLTR